MVDINLNNHSSTFMTSKPTLLNFRWIDFQTFRYKLSLLRNNFNVISLTIKRMSNSNILRVLFMKKEAFFRLLVEIRHNNAEKNIKVYEMTIVNMKTDVPTSPRML